MEEVSGSTTFMKKVVISIIILVSVIGGGVALFSTPQNSMECSVDTEKVSPVDIDAEASPF